MRRLLLFVVLLLVPTMAWAQGNTNTVPPACTAATLLTTCVPQIKGTVARVTDAANSALLCTGGGSTEVTCQFNGTVWQTISTTHAGAGRFVGLYGEIMDNGTNAEFTFASNANTDVTLMGEDTTGASNLIIDTTGAGTITIGSGDVTNVIIAGGDLTLGQVETATFGAPNTMTATPAALNQIVGIPKLGVTHTIALANGVATAEPFHPATGSCAPITAGTEVSDTTNFVTSTASYKYTAQATAAEDDGFDCDVTGHAVVGTDSVGFWFRSNTALTAGTLDVTLDDGTSAEANANLPAITVINEWQWIEVDLVADCDATCADIDGIFIQVTAAGAATDEMDGTIINIDSGAFWLDTGETPIGDIQVGGLIDFSTGLITPAAAGEQTDRVEWIDYFINYQTGADAIIPIVDLSATYGTTLEALN